MTLNFQMSESAAAMIAEYLEANGALQDAAQVWWNLSLVDPYDRLARERFCDLVFESQAAPFACGTVERGRFLLSIIGNSFPTPKLTAAYLENLRQTFSRQPKRPAPGRVILGPGSGRCGSTTLASAIASIPGACATHENPPLVFWQPFEEQVRFHFDRFRLLADYCPVVFDAGHWWLNVLDRFFAEFPDGKVIGLHRNVDGCSESFLRIKGRGKRSFNHWAMPGNAIWSPNPWDPVYPSYTVPEGIQPDTEEAYLTKAAMIRRYVTEYNQLLLERAEAWPERILLLRTEELGEDQTRKRLQQFVGEPIVMPAAPLNVGTWQDGLRPQFRF